MRSSTSMGWCIAFAVATVCAASTAGSDETADRAAVGADGVQRVAIVGGSYFFRPDHVVVRAGQPLEFSLRMESGVIPHRFVLESADGKVVVDVSLAQEVKTIRLTLAAGRYTFHCPNRLLFLASHRERGMAGVLEAGE